MSPLTFLVSMNLYLGPGLWLSVLPDLQESGFLAEAEDPVLREGGRVGGGESELKSQARRLGK